MRPLRSFETSAATRQRTQRPSNVAFSDRMQFSSLRMLYRKGHDAGTPDDRPFARPHLAHRDCGCGQATLAKATAKNVNWLRPASAWNTASWTFTVSKWPPFASYAFKALWLLYIPQRLTFPNSTFCPHSVFMCFVWISEQTAIISLYNIN
jgi:hypothetical protein